MSQLGYVGVDEDFVLEPGRIGVAIGSSADDLRATGEFTVVGKTIRLQAQRSYLSTATVTST